MQVVATFLERLILCGAVRHGELTMFPLVRPEPCEPAYVTLDEGIAGGHVRVTEVSAAGRVPELLVVNGGILPLLILDGEELIGAKQNRIVNTTLLIPPKTRLPIPVSCVEAGRWHAVGRESRPADRVYHAHGRRAKLAHVTASMRHDESRASDQGAIWSEIAEKSARLGASSPTGAAAAMYETCGSGLDSLVQALEAVDNQVGAIFAIGNVIAGLDVVDSARTWRALHPKLVRSYGLDALDPLTARRPLATPQPAAFLKAVCGAPAQSFPALGMGTDIRFECDSVTGAALVDEGAVVHVVAFPPRPYLRPPFPMPPGPDGQLPE